MFIMYIGKNERKITLIDFCTYLHTPHPPHTHTHTMDFDGISLLLIEMNQFADFSKNVCIFICLSFQSWSYKEQESELEKKGRTFLRCLKAAAVNVPALSSQREGRNKEKEYETIRPGITSSANNLLYCRNKDMNAHATITGLQLKSGGATKQTHRRLHARSLSVSYSTTIKRQEMLGVGFDEDVRQWKAEVEKDVGKLKSYKEELDHLEHKIAEGHHNFHDTIRWRKVSDDYSKLQLLRHPGFQLVGDNIDFVTKPRHQTSEHGKKDLHYFNFLAVKNKVNFIFLL